MESPIYKIKMANKKDADGCIYLSKCSTWWADNEVLGERHIKKCVEQERCLVVVANDHIIGFLMWGELWNKIHLEDIFIQQEYRRLGIASQLIKEISKIAKERGFLEIMSDCDISNKQSIHLHLKNGFEECGYIKNNWDNEDSYVFSKKI